jgi:hypothetical protein
MASISPLPWRLYIHCQFRSDEKKMISAVHIERGVGLDRLDIKIQNFRTYANDSFEEHQQASIPTIFE